jgi:hypothetical protein
MGYIHELQEELRKMLGDLDEEKQQEIARYVGRKILESYRNGIESVKILQAGTETAPKRRVWERRIRTRE